MGKDPGTVCPTNPGFRISRKANPMTFSGWDEFLRPSIHPEKSRRVGGFLGFFCNPHFSREYILSHGKKPTLLSMKYRLVNRDPYNGLL